MNVARNLDSVSKMNDWKKHVHISSTDICLEMIQYPQIPYFTLITFIKKIDSQTRKN